MKTKEFDFKLDIWPSFFYHSFSFNLEPWCLNFKVWILYQSCINKIVRITGSFTFSPHEIVRITCSFTFSPHKIERITCSFTISPHLVGGGMESVEHYSCSLLHCTYVTFFWNVPSNAATITVLPRSAISSQNSTTSTNWNKSNYALNTCTSRIQSWVEWFSLKYHVKIW